MKPYKPTRSCPHRWCKPLHIIPVPFALAVLAFDLWHNILFMVVLAVSMTAGAVLQKTLYFKRRQRGRPATVSEVVQDLRDAPSVADLEMKDAKYEGTGWRMLEVRKGWARVAVASDIVLVALVGVLAVSVFSHPNEAAKGAEAMQLDMVGLLGMAISTAFFGFSLYAHKKATQPRKPKRAWLPAALQTDS